MIQNPKEDSEDKEYFMNQEDRELKKKKSKNISKNHLINDNRTSGRGWD